MRDLLDFIQGNDAYFLMGLSALSLVLLICVISLSGKLSKISKRYNTKLTDGTAGEIADCLAQQTSAIAEMESRLDQIAAAQAQQQRELAGCVQKVSVVRYDAFEDVGGEQSFALVLLDGENNGVALSSLYGRQDTRFYAKGINKGEGDRTLSGEEQDALKKALAGNGR